MYSILYFTSLIEQIFPLFKTTCTCIFFGLLVAVVWYNHDWNVLILDQLESFAVLSAYVSESSECTRQSLFRLRYM